MDVPSPAERELARQLDDLRKQVRALARGSQAAHRSVQLSDGPVEFYGEDGTTRMVLGPDDAGIVTLQDQNPEPPPQPEAPTVVLKPGAVVVIYDGTFVEDNVPVNLAYYEIHGSQTPGYVKDDSTQIGTFASVDGGVYAFQTDYSDGPWYFSIVAVSRANLESEPSVEVEGRGAPYPTYSPTAAPSASPEIVNLYGTANGIMVETEVPEPGALLTYYLSTTPDFTADSTSIVNVEGAGTNLYVITVDPATGEPLLPNIDYYIRAWAFNSLGYAPAPSDDVKGNLDLEVPAAFIASIIKSALTMTGELRVGGISIHPVNGMVIPLPNGGEIRFPANGETDARITAHIFARSMTVENNLLIQGSGQLQGELLMANGITDPNLPAQVSYGWPTVDMAAFGGLSDDISTIFNGLEEYDTNSFMGAFNYFGAGIRLINKITGAASAFPDPTQGKTWTAGFYPFGGIARLGTSGASRAFILGSDSNRSGNVYIYRINMTTWEKDDEVYIGNYNVFGGAQPRLVAEPVSGRVLMIWTTTAGSMILRRFEYSLDFVSDTTLLGGGALPGRFDIGGVAHGPYGPGGATRLYVALKSSSYHIMAFSVSGSTYTQVALETKVRANGSLIQGMAWDSTAGQLVTFSTTARLSRYAKHHTAINFRGAYSWYDGNTSSGSTTHETMISPRTGTALVTLQPGAYPKITGRPAPDVNNADPTNLDKANLLRVYGSINADATFTYFEQLPLEQVTSGFLEPGASMPVQPSNGFVGAGVTPGAIKSTATDADGIIIDANGAGEARLGPLSFKANDARALFYHAGRTAALNVANNTWTQVPMDTLISALRGDMTTPGGTCVVPRIGLYDVRANIHLSTPLSATGRRIARLEWDTVASPLAVGAGNFIAQAELPASAGAYPAWSASALLELPALARVRMCVLQSSGAVVTLYIADPKANQLMVRRTW